jgi:hypothetical protein
MLRRQQLNTCLSERPAFQQASYAKERQWSRYGAQRYAERLDDAAGEADAAKLRPDEEDDAPDDEDSAS